MFRRLYWLVGCLVVSIVSFAGPVLADQAAWVTQPVASKAIDMIPSGAEVRLYCAPCGDKAWTVVKAKQVEWRNVSVGMCQVFLNGEGIDLAYAYAKEKDKWRNLALSLKLDVSDVPEFLPEKPEELAALVKSFNEAAAAAGSENTEEAWEGDDIHAIDMALSECMARDSSTAGSVACLDTAYKAWDAELNRVYQELGNRAGAERKESLKKAQLAWIKYRDTEFEWIITLYAKETGTMYTVMAASDRVEVVRRRALELSAYLGVLTAGN